MEKTRENYTISMPRHPIRSSRYKDSKGGQNNLYRCIFSYTISVVLSSLFCEVAAQSKSLIVGCRDLHCWRGLVHPPEPPISPISNSIQKIQVRKTLAFWKVSHTFRSDAIFASSIDAKSTSVYTFAYGRPQDPYLELIASRQASKQRVSQYYVTDAPLEVRLLDGSESTTVLGMCAFRRRLKSKSVAVVYQQNTLGDVHVQELCALDAEECPNTIHKGYLSRCVLSWAYIECCVGFPVGPRL